MVKRFRKKIFALALAGVFAFTPAVSNIRYVNADMVTEVRLAKE